ncbi:MAG: folate family ECF transporter S component [Ruminococcus sp.]|nr:folate family ECF transporter S component [Ruminococcus sp.]
MNEKKKINLKTSTPTLVIFAILMAAEIVIAQFLTIHTWNLKITLSFIPVVIAARIYGPIGGGLVAGVGDFLGAFMFPVGPWFPPITLTTAAVGVIFGLFLKNSDNFLRVLISVLISELIFSMFITPIWLMMLYGTDYWILVGSRLIQVAVLIAIKLIIIPPILKLTNILAKSYRKEFS